MLNTKKQFELYQSAKALGELALLSEFTIVFDGFENMKFLTKQFPIPISAPEEVVEVPMVGGMKAYTPQITRTDFRGTLALKETVSGQVRQFLEQIGAERTISNRGRVSCTVYMGTEEEHTQKWRCLDCVLFGFEPLDADAENRGSLAIYQGQIAGMYFPGVE